MTLEPLLSHELDALVHELQRASRDAIDDDSELCRSRGSKGLTAAGHRWSTTATIASVDENRSDLRLSAPGRGGGATALRLPPARQFPRLDDHLVEPEVTRDELIGGVRVVASPAKPPHATLHVRLDYVVTAYTAPGYQAASDLLTRHDAESDFATDTCVFKAGVDPETGDRHLEEIAFEVVSSQNQGYVAEKARRMVRRGVRRVFTVWAKRRRICEWSPTTESWRVLPPGSFIEDPCLAAPLAVDALLDAAAADDAVVEVLGRKGTAALRRREEEAAAVGEARGKTNALAQAVLEVLSARNVEVSAAQRGEILAQQDAVRLARWLRRASVATSADEVTAEE